MLSKSSFYVENRAVAENIREKCPDLEKKYGSVFVIAAILSIIYHSILLWRLWKKKNKAGRLECFILDRKIRKEFPDLYPSERKALINEICSNLHRIKTD